MQDRVKYIVRKSLQGINTSCKTEANIPNMIVVKGTPRDYKQIGKSFSRFSLCFPIVYTCLGLDSIKLHCHQLKSSCNKLGDYNIKNGLSRPKLNLNMSDHTNHLNSVTLISCKGYKINNYLTHYVIFWQSYIRLVWEPQV